MQKNSRKKNSLNGKGVDKTINSFYFGLEILLLLAGHSSIFACARARREKEKRDKGKTWS